MKLLRSKWVWLTLVGVFFVEFLSALAYMFPGLEPWFFGLVVLAVGVIAFYRLRIGVGIILAELIIGSKGHLLGIPLGEVDFSLRMGLFTALIIATAYNILTTKQVRFFQARTQHLFFLLFVALGLGLGLAFINGNDISLIYKDANAYLFFLLIFPFYQAIKKYADIKTLFSMMVGAVIAGLIKTGLLLLAFSHDFPYLVDIYRWTRDTGVGEITHLLDSYRIFFQSHIYMLIFFIFILVFLAVIWQSKFSVKHIKPYYILLSGCAAAIILSGSRSIWLAAFCALVTLIAAFLVIKKLDRPIWSKIGWTALLTSIGGMLWIIGITSIPLPGIDRIEFSTSSLVSERTTGTGSDAASSSRFALLKPLLKATEEQPIFGSGFGSTVTYHTKDARYIDMNGHDRITTYAFEWGYLDIIYKTGVVGLIGWGIVGCGLLTFVILLVKNEKKPSRQIVLLTSGIGVVVLFSIHLTTPYLNHPLGIGWLLFSAAVIESSIKEHS